MYIPEVGMISLYPICNEVRALESMKTALEFRAIRFGLNYLQRGRLYLMRSFLMRDVVVSDLVRHTSAIPELKPERHSRNRHT